MNESDSVEQQSVEINNIQVADLLKYDWQTKGPKKMRIIWQTLQINLFKIMEDQSAEIIKETVRKSKQFHQKKFHRSL